ncbi:MAG: sigma-70 family RNA polymerase sigma factor [Planctomycetes bacterium]|nr:sigma-70 family RNA polymerase sigma factor [Planctomycetota bacterium]MCL4729518.1 sigma-70 family RNA polymerase sigma factor [Planctomycetota bacterium]
MGEVFESVPAMVPALRRGDTEAYRQLVRIMGEPLLRYAHSITGRADLAEDVVQDAFLRIYRLRGKLRLESEFRGLCFRITRNLARNALRDHNLRRRREQEAAMTPTRDPRGLELARQAWEQIKLLPEALREVLVLRFACGLSREEVAAALDIPEGTVATRQRKGLEEIRGKLDTTPVLGLPALDALLANTAIPSAPSPDLINLEELVMSGIQSMKRKAAALVASVAIATLVLATTGAAVVYGLTDTKPRSDQLAAARTETTPGSASSRPLELNGRATGSDSGASHASHNSGTGTASVAAPQTPPASQTPANKERGSVAADSGIPSTDATPIPPDTVAPRFLSEPPEIILSGNAYEYTVLVSGLPEPVLSVAGAPRWLKLDGNILHGMPAPEDQGLTGWISLFASNGVMPDAEQRFRILVTAAPAFTSSPPTKAVAGTEYRYQLVATGTPAPTFTASGLPAWLTLKGDWLTGTPSAGDSGPTGEIVLTADNGIRPDATQRFSIDVAGPPRFVSTPPTTVKAGEAYSYKPQTAGSPDATVTAKGLPGWLVFDNGVLTGVPRNSDIGVTRKITLTADNGHKPAAEQIFTVTVEKNPNYVELPWTLKDLKKFYKVGLKWVVREEGRKFTATGKWITPLCDYEVTAVDDKGVTLKVTHRSYQTTVEGVTEKAITQDLTYTWDSLLAGNCIGGPPMKVKSCTAVKEKINGKMETCWLLVYDLPKGSQASDIRVWVFENKPGIAVKVEHTYPSGPRPISEIDSWK